MIQIPAKSKDKIRIGDAVYSAYVEHDGKKTQAYVKKLIVKKISPDTVLYDEKFPKIEIKHQKLSEYFLSPKDALESLLKPLEQAVSACKEKLKNI